MTISRCFRDLQQILVAAGEEAADVGEAVLLGAHGAAVGVAEDLAHDLGDRAVPCPASRCLMNQAFSAKRQASI